MPHHSVAWKKYYEHTYQIKYKNNNTILKEVIE